MPAGDLDEQFHAINPEVGAWSESFYFNFSDPKTGLAMMTRMGFRPNEKYCDGLHVVYLGKDRLAFTHTAGKLENGFPEVNAGLQVGGLKLEMVEPFKKWVISYEGPCEDVPNGPILMQQKKQRPAGWMKPSTLSMRVEFTATADQFYTADDSKHGHFEQVGNVVGTVKVGDEQWQVDGRGVRDKSWGAREWSSSGSVVPKKKPEDGAAAAPPKPSTPSSHIHWFSLTFGKEAALNAACARGPDGEMRGQGWLQVDGKTQWFRNVTVTSEYQKPDPSRGFPNEILHTGMRILGKGEDGTEVDVTGVVNTICPTKVPMKGGATFINEGLATFNAKIGQRAGLVGTGIAEYWTNVKNDAASKM